MRVSRHSFEIEIAHSTVRMNVVCVGYEIPNCRNKFLKFKVIHFYHKLKFEVHEPIYYLQ
jgi:hypothetical protein